MAQIGYIRVSTIDQHLDRQLADIRDTLDKVYEDKLSGKNMDRPGFEAMMDYVREGDTLHVHELSRLGRNTADLLNIIKMLTAKGVVIHFHKEHIITAEDSPFATMMITVLSGVAQLERDMMLLRQREGYAAAKAAGRIAGRGKSRSIDRQGIALSLAAGVSIRNTAKKFGVSTSTVQSVKAEVAA